MSSCSIKQCSARRRKNQPALSFHRFPKSEVLLRKWLKAIGAENINARHKDLFICSLHFEESQFSRTLDVIRIRDNAVPTLFNKITPTQMIAEQKRQTTSSLTSKPHDKMSFRNYKQKIDEGDTVILYLSNNVHAIEVKREIKNKKGDMVENVYQTTFGALKVKNLIGVEYGSRVELSKGWGHVLQPTPELWSVTLPHRTQIIYTPDISMILLQLDLVPGCVVIEAGTGSGSLTHALIRRVRPHGHVHTFDFHEHRAKIAHEEFESHGLADFVTAKHRDVLEKGFGESLNGKADAVFLDLPSPWAGIPHAVAAIKDEGGRFCSFSPCIEQVQRTCLALKEQGFQELATMEVLQTEIKVSRRTIPVRDLSFLKHKGSENPVEEKPTSDTCLVVGTWPASTPGHTGYLTVATLPPLFIRDKRARTEISSEKTSENDVSMATEESQT